MFYTTDGTLWVADLCENKVTICDASTGEELNEFETLSSCHRASCFSNDGTQFAICNTRGDVQVWKADTLSTEALFSGFKSTAFSVAFLQEGRALVSSHWGTTGKVFWDIESRKTQRIFPSLTERASLRRTVALSPLGGLLASETGNGSIKVWNINSETLVAELTEHENHVISFNFSPTGKHLVSAGTQGELFVWDIERWEKQHSLTPDKNEGVGPAQWHMGDKRVAFHPDGKQVAAISHNDKARVWDVESGEHLVTFPLPEDLESPIPYKNEPQEIQQPENPKLKRSSDPLLRAIAFSSRGTFIASGREGEVILWATNTSQIRMVIRLPETGWRPCALAFSPSDRYLAVGSWWCGTDRVPIQLWEVATGEHIHTFWGHASDVQDVTFSPDGTLLASGSFDGTVLLWNMEPFINS